MALGQNSGAESSFEDLLKSRPTLIDGVYSEESLLPTLIQPAECRVSLAVYLEYVQLYPTCISPPITNLNKFLC
jgi:hypothetical protein